MPTHEAVRWAKALLKQKLRDALQTDFSDWCLGRQLGEAKLHECRSAPWGDPLTKNCVEMYNRYPKTNLSRQVKHRTSVLQALLDEMRTESMKQGAFQHLPAIGTNSTEAKRVLEQAQAPYARLLARRFSCPPPLVPTLALSPFPAGS